MIMPIEYSMNGKFVLMFRSTTFRQEVLKHCFASILGKIELLDGSLAELNESLENETKSSAGDKHETSRAMVQIEMENLSKQISRLKEQQQILRDIERQKPSSFVKEGSLVVLGKQILFVAIPLGKISVDGIEVVVLSVRSPLGQKLAGLKMNEEVEVNGSTFRIRI